MIDEQARRAEILKAEETIRALARQLGEESERIKRFDSATRTLDDSRGALLNATSLVQQSVVAVESANSIVTERLNATSAKQLSLSNELLTGVAECRVSLSKLEECLSHQAKSIDDFAEAQKRHGTFVRWVLISSGVANALMLAVLLVRSFLGHF